LNQCDIGLNAALRIENKATDAAHPDGGAFAAMMEGSNDDIEISALQGWGSH
jgi:hypothetical protein